MFFVLMITCQFLLLKIGIWVELLEGKSVHCFEVIFLVSTILASHFTMLLMVVKQEFGLDEILFHFYQLEVILEALSLLGFILCYFILISKILNHALPLESWVYHMAYGYNWKMPGIMWIRNLLVRLPTFLYSSFWCNLRYGHGYPVYQVLCHLEVFCSESVVMISCFILFTLNFLRFSANIDPSLHLQGLQTCLVAWLSWYTNCSVHGS